MAKGSVRKKGKKWYYRFYIEDESGNRVQKEFPGTESKAETESMLRKAMEDYEAKQFVGKADNITLGEVLDMWVEEELKPGNLSNGTVMAYINAAARIKKHPLGNRRLKTVTTDEYLKLTEFLQKKNNPALLAVQIAYYTGLRIGEVCGLTWQDINLEGQYLTVRRSMRYNGTRHKTEVGTTKRSKVRTVDFCDTLAAILKTAKTEQHKNRFRYGELYRLNYCKTVKEQGRTYYEVYSLARGEELPEDYKELSFVCLKADGSYVSPSAVGQICQKAKRTVEGLEGFHFHTLRHTYTSNLLSGGAKPTDVQELLGHSDVSTTMNIYAHATREAKRTSARLLDKVVGEA